MEQHRPCIADESVLMVTWLQTDMLDADRANVYEILSLRRYRGSIAACFFVVCTKLNELWKTIADVVFVSLVFKSCDSVQPTFAKLTVELSANYTRILRETTLIQLYCTRRLVLSKVIQLIK